MSFKVSASFYCAVYCICAVAVLFIEQSFHFGFGRTAMIILPVLLTFSLIINYSLYKASLGKQTGFVNALMLTSMGRLVGFATVLVAAVFLNREFVAPLAALVSVLYLISVGADSYFSKRFR